MSQGGASLLIIVLAIGMIVIDAVRPAHDPYWDDEEGPAWGSDETGTGAPK